MQANPAYLSTSLLPEQSRPGKFPALEHFLTIYCWPQISHRWSQLFNLEQGKNITDRAGQIQHTSRSPAFSDMSLGRHTFRLARAAILEARIQNCNLSIFNSQSAMLF